MPSPEPAMRRLTAVNGTHRKRGWRSDLRSVFDQQHPPPSGWIALFWDDEHPSSVAECHGRSRWSSGRHGSPVRWSAGAVLDDSRAHSSSLLLGVAMSAGLGRGSRTYPEETMLEGTFGLAFRLAKAVLPFLVSGGFGFVHMVYLGR